MSARRTFGATWWGAAWIDALEHRARLDPNRLPRGRTYARQGRAGDVAMEAGQITARVIGSRSTPYRVRVRVRTFTDGEWAGVVDAICAKAAHAAALLDGELDPGVVDDARSAGVDVLPGPGDLQPRCSCPDWADPCKHAAAVCYLVADALDDDPFLLFAVRGRNRDDLLAAVRRRRTRGAATGRGDGSPADADADGGSDADPRHGRDRPDPGVGARAAWTGARDAAAEGTSRPLPPDPPVRPEPGPPAPWPVDPPPDAPFSAEALRSLVEDAAARAHAMLREGSGSGLSLDEGDDLSRRAARALGTDGWARLVARSSLGPRALAGRALAWQVAGREGVDMAGQEPWPAGPLVMATGRSALVDAGLPVDQVKVQANRASAGSVQLRVDRDGRWWPFEKRRGRWELAGPGEPTADGALDHLHDPFDPAH